jgi:hypothetical protein
MPYARCVAIGNSHHHDDPANQPKKKEGEGDEDFRIDNADKRCDD